MACPIEAVVFDLGGTLIEYAGPNKIWPDLETPGLQAAYDSLKSKKVSLPPFSDFRDSAFTYLPGRWQAATEGTRNLRLADFLSELLQVNGVNGVPEEWIAEAADVYQETICAHAEMIEGARDVLADLKEAGFKIALLSNTMFTGSIHQADLRRFDLDPFFDAMLFSADLGLWKPSAAPYLFLLENLGAAPENAVFVGDSPEHDVVGGRNAGMHTIYFRSSDRFEEPDGVQPDRTIHRLDELPRVLSSWCTGTEQ
jgi:HAD superfamily hydrolase (TIGR01509 family)